MRKRTLEFYTTNGKWNWRYIGLNGEVMGGHNQGYNRLSDCKKSANIVTGDQVKRGLVHVVVSQ